MNKVQSLENTIVDLKAQFLDFEAKARKQAKVDGLVITDALNQAKSLEAKLALARKRYIEAENTLDMIHRLTK